MKYCQSPNCHWYNTQDRLKGSGENKSYQTRKASKFYFGNGNFCTLKCQDNWFKAYGNMAIDHFGRMTTPKKRNKNAPDYFDLREQTVERLYGSGVRWWNTNVDFDRVSQEIENTINQSTN
jgi:hypothetical protein